MRVSETDVVVQVVALTSGLPRGGGGAPLGNDGVVRMRTVDVMISTGGMRLRR